ncbi:MAG TPA: signal peptide peptidase SppA, partial [Erythrobacter sp.]|nr:signal peptide peptidase SppA [Erythrobacter sp.]HAW34688.1 signal peptide peptidase SppA [Erythrobacter sp.]HCO46092.1 signal peptide peptidase SppA [Erythrobacter sp.]
SGGYWVSTPADRIFAEPETITGSIGIFAVIPTFEETAAMAGVTSDGVRTTPLSGQPDLIAGFTPETDAILQAFIEDGYED